MLKNIRFAGMEVVTLYGKVKYDEEGTTTDLTKEQEKDFKDIPGYEVLDDTFQEETTEAEEEPKEVEEEPEEELVEEKAKYSKSELRNKTVAELEDLAKEEGYEISDGVKKEKIQDILDEQKREG